MVSKIFRLRTCIGLVWFRSLGVSSVWELWGVGLGVQAPKS